MNDAYSSIEEYNPRKKRKVFIVFDITAYVTIKKKLHPVFTDLFIRRQKLNISLVFTMKIPNIRGFEQIVVSHSCDSDYDDFKRFLRKYTADLFSFLVNNTTLPSKPLLRFWSWQLMIKSETKNSDMLQIVP